MKKLISALILAISPIAFAQNASEGIRLFSVKKAQFAPEHISNFASGTVQIDYDRNVVKLLVSRATRCPGNKVCAMMVQPPLVEEFSISSVQEKHCGIRHITAVQDERAANGLLKTITITDSSDLMCRSLALYHSHAEYETSQLDLSSEQPTLVRSQMLLEEVSSENLQ